SWQFSPHACNTGANQGLVADELEGEADQDRREGGEPRTLCRLPNGGGRHPTTNVPGDSAADRGTTAAATTRASMKRSIVTRSSAIDRRNASLSQCIAKQYHRPNYRSLWSDEKPIAARVCSISDSAGTFCACVRLLSGTKQKPHGLL